MEDTKKFYPEEGEVSVLSPGQKWPGGPFIAERLWVYRHVS